MHVLLVDDEYEIRNGLSQILSESRWDGISITGVTEAGDSVQALEYLAQHEIDIVITDIRMPGMDGLGLTETIQYRHPHIPVIILSGYYDQENVRTALRSGASDFLYKPVQLTDLERALRSMIKKNRHHKKKSLHISLQQFHAVSRTQYKVIMAADIDDLSSERVGQFGDMNMLSWLMNKVASECAEDMEGIYFISDQTKAETVNLLLGISAPTAKEAVAKAERWSDAVSQFWDAVIKLTVSFGISSAFAESDPEAYVYHAKCALFVRTVHGGGRRTSLPDISAEAGQLSGRPRMGLETRIETGDMDGLAREVEGAVDQLYKTKDAVRLIKELESLIVFLYQKITELFPGNTLKMSDLQLQKMLWYRSREDLLQQLMSWLNMVFAEQEKEERSGHFMIKAEEYILQNFHKPLTLADVAHQCYLSPNYVSRLFREKKGMTFLELLTSVRIEKAKRMLHEPGVRIYEVAEAVGYGSWKHFCRVFKEVTNTTPTEYRKKLDQ